MKKILSLVLAFSFFCSEASFMEKVKALPATAKIFAVNTKNFGIKTIDAVSQNKKATFIAALAIGIAGQRLYTLGKPNDYKLICEDKNNFLSTAKNKPLGWFIETFFPKVGVSADNINKILDKGIKPLTYAQNLSDNGCGLTLGILAFLSKLALKAE